jgi:hypothetical protein
VKPIARWDRLFHIVEENDPARHLKSIHNGEETMSFDHRKPWIDHVCIQNWNVKRTADWRREWGKPIVNDELEYEGDISLAWGDLTAQELTHRFWVTLTRGGYAGEVDVIDAWNMTIASANRVPCPVYPRLRQRGGALTESKPIAAFAVELRPKPYQAIRIRRARS